MLERVLEDMRRTGVPCYEWPHLKLLLLAKLKVALELLQAAEAGASGRGRHEERCASITELLNTFEGCVEKRCGASEPLQMDADGLVLCAAARPSRCSD